MDDIDTLTRRDLSDPAHAVYTIARYLDALDLNEWSGVLTVWLGQYDGLDQYMFEEEWPVVMVRELLASYIANPRKLDAREFVKDLAALPFLHYRARMENGEGKWEPLLQPFVEYAQGDGNVLVWESPYPYPPAEITEAYLFATFMSQKLGITVGFDRH